MLGTTYETPSVAPARVLPLEGTMTFTIGTPMKEIEQEVILQTLKSLDYNRTRTAKQLGIGIRTLQRKLKKYGKPNYGFETEEVSTELN
jgi:DNA-binding NtrC family response regulator